MVNIMALLFKFWNKACLKFISRQLKEKKSKALSLCLLTCLKLHKLMNTSQKYRIKHMPMILTRRMQQSSHWKFSFFPIYNDEGKPSDDAIKVTVIPVLN
jgi:hypothetical protein